MNFRWIDQDRAFVELLDTLQGEPRYALDTEFVSERSYRPRLALVQIGWSGGIALVDPLVVSLAPLERLLRGDGLAIRMAAPERGPVVERGRISALGMLLAWAVSSPPPR